jgi:hypothetical protein
MTVRFEVTDQDFVGVSFGLKNEARVEKMTPSSI